MTDHGNNPLESVASCVERLATKFDAFSKQYCSTLDTMLTHMHTLERELIAEADSDAELSVTAILIWEQCLKKVNDVLAQMGREHRGMHGGVSKCGKEIDRNFVNNYMGLFKAQQCYESNTDLRTQICRLIADHLLSQGHLDVAEILAEEVGIPVQDENRAIFKEMNMIIEALKRKDIEPALLWATVHADKLAGEDNKLEFSLHKLKFVQFLRDRDRQGALSYSREFQKFADRYRADVQQLMGSLMYLPDNLSTSPYSHLIDDDKWSKIEDTFTRDACSLYGLSTQSPLSVILNAGTVALPALVGLRRVMQQRQVPNIWTHQSDELPMIFSIEIDLGPDRHYHSVFSCPILRQQTTKSNPPMRLQCGHVISRDALHKLAQNNRHFRLKCPYCPTESTVSDAKRIYF